MKAILLTTYRMSCRLGRFRRRKLKFTLYFQCRKITYLDKNFAYKSAFSSSSCVWPKIGPDKQRCSIEHVLNCLQHVQILSF